MSGVPEHKCIPGTAVTVDAFRHQQPWVKAYFLSHAHADHYMGLTENWRAGPIYCSPVTAALAQQLCGVPAAFLRPLPLNISHTIEEQPGLTVVLVDANHCPGAVQFLFTVPDGRRYVHCGDMRYCSAMKADVQLQKFVGADAVFLDTTYCHPKHLFPPQDEAVEFVASRIRQLLQEDEACSSPTAAAAAPATATARGAVPRSEDEAAAPTTPRQLQQQQQQQQDGDQQQQQQQDGDQQQQQQQAGSSKQQWQPVEKLPPFPAAAVGCFRRLYLISTYVIGKERLLLATADATGRRLVVTQRKMDVLRCVGLSPEQLSRCFTTDPAESPIHVTGWGHLGDTWPYFRPNFTNMEAAGTDAGAEQVVGFVPTGWLYEMKSAAYPSRVKGPCSVHLVPYSEHSSYAELREYVAWLRPKQIIPTVGTSGGDKARTAMLQHFRGLIDEQHNKAAFLARMRSGGSAASKRSLPLSSPADAEAATAAAAGDDDVDVGSREAAAAVDGGVDVMVLDDAGDDPAVAAGCEGADEDSSEGFFEMPHHQRSAPLAAAAADASIMQAVPEVANSVEVAGQAAAAAAAAAAAVELGEDSVLGGDSETVQLLLAIAGPDSNLTAAEAQQLLAAAAGDVNAAMNAFLDNQSRHQQQQQAPPQPGGARASGSKRQQQQSSSADARSSGGSKKARKQQGAAAAGSAGAGQASITSFFGVRASPKQQQQPLDALRRQQQQQQNEEAPTALAAAADGGGAVSQPMLVLPALTKRPAAAVGGGASRGRQLRRAGVPAGPHVQQQQQQDSIGATLSTPAETAGTVLDSGVEVVADVPAAVAESKEVAPEEEAGRSTEAAQQQQQKQKQKQLWSTLLSGSSPSPVKRTNSSSNSKPADKAAAAATPAAHHPAATDNTAAEASPAAVAAAPAALAKDALQMPMLGVTSNSGSSSSKPLSKAIREAPLLKLAKYNPLRDACWGPTDAAPYLAVAVTLAAIDGTSSRLLIADGLTNMFRSLMLLAPGQVTAAAYLVCGKIAPEYALGADLNIGGSVVSSALCEVCGVSRGQLRELYNSMGDLGDVAQACRRKQSSLLPPPPLTIAGVFAALHSLASTSGTGAAGRRQSTVAKLLRCCRDVETKYLVRTLIQNLRVGAGWRSVLGPLAKAALLHRKMLQEAGLLESPTLQQQQQGVEIGNISGKSAAAAASTSCDVAAAAAAFAASSAAKVSKQQLEAAAAAAAAAYHSCPNLDIIVKVLMSEGPEALAQHVQLTCGVPVKPMLAKACTSVADSFVQLAATAAAAAAAGGVRAGRRSGGNKQGVVKGAVPLAKAAAAAAEVAAAAAVVIDSEDEEDGSGGDVEEVTDGADEEAEQIEELAAAAAAASVAAASDGKAAGKQQQQQQQQLLQGAGAAASSSSSSLALLAEYKYDGQRAQIHVAADGKVAVFSRNCEDRTASFFAEAQAVLAAADPAALPLVIDAELVAVDRANGNRVRAFQELATRPRGSSAAAAAAGATAASPGSKQQRSKHQQQQQLAFGPSAAAQARSTESAEASAPPPPAAALVSSAAASGPQQQQQAGSNSNVDICIFAFDALCIGGRDLMALSLRQRRAALAAALPGLAPGVVQMAEGVEVTLPLPVQGVPAVVQQAAAVDEAAASGAAGACVEAAAAAAAVAVHESVVVEAAAAGSPAEESVTEFFFAALAAGSEGLMMKLLDGPGSVYQPARRGLSWVKLKRDYLEGLADSLDLVPIGAWRGNGRKVKWFSPFLLAVYDADTETFQSLCRCMSGFTDEFYAAATARLGATAIPGPKPYYDTHERPDVWFEPTEVWELRGADISISPVHRAAAGLIDPAKGLGLRFPRFLRLRPDKKPEEASGPDTIAELYNKQARRVR